MSYHDRETPKDWEDKLKDFNIKQDITNRLVMDFLLVGMMFCSSNDKHNFNTFTCFLLKRDTKKQLKSFKKNLALNLQWTCQL